MDLVAIYQQTRENYGSMKRAFMCNIVFKTSLLKQSNFKYVITNSLKAMKL